MKSLVLLGGIVCLTIGLCWSYSERFGSTPTPMSALRRLETRLPPGYSVITLQMHTIRTEDGWSRCSISATLGKGAGEKAEYREVDAEMADICEDAAVLVLNKIEDAK